MTDPEPSAENPATPPPSVAPGAMEGKPAEAQRATSRAGSPSEARSAKESRDVAHSVATTAGSIGNWLASIGWGKFFLLLLLVLAALSLADDMFTSAHKGHRHHPNVPVELKISVDADGLHIARPPVAQKGGQSNGHESGTVVITPNMSVDEKGVRIETDKDGQKSTVVVDQHGVRIEHGPSAAGKTPPEPPVPPKPPGGDSKAGPSGPVVTVPPDLMSDPDKISEAVEAAKDQIEELVQDQVDQKVAGLKGDNDDGSSAWSFTNWGLILGFALLIVKIAMGSKRRAETRAQAADAVAAEEGLKRQLAEAQLKTMQAQVEPHFLFNTLASVDYLIETDPARASRMQKNLIQYLRAAVPQMRQASSTLGQEMALCRSYLEILKVRMDDRLQFAITMPAGLSTAAFPPMMLQTLVENSIKHGLEPKPEGGALTLNADVVDGNLRVAVSDTGLGFGAAGSGGSGVGLNNVRERLQALFGARGRLTIEPNSPNGTIATVVVPYAVGVVEPTPQVWPQPA
ncbi:MAG TPA: histidine kinase [Burkholderiaceae bacterium]|nr:histidine kinase [Burkholderiaceae bacterium]